MSGQLSEGKMITYAKEEIVNVFKGIHHLTDMAQHYQPGGADLQRSNNQYWKPVQQQSNAQDGWDLTGQEDGVLELSVAGGLGDPANVFRKLRADDVRDETSYRRAVQADAKRLLGQMEFRGLEKVRTHGAFCVTDSNPFGSTFEVWDGLSLASTRMTATEFDRDKGTCSFLNPTAYQQGGKNLIQSTARFRNNLPDDAYDEGYIGRQIAGISDVYEHAKLARMTAQAAALTVNGDQSFAPLASETSPSGSEVPFDNRFAVLPVTGVTTGVNVGDKFSIAGVKAVSLDEKIVLDYDQTFTVVAINGQNLTISPRPIALDDVALSDLEKRYANINTTISNLDALVWLNTTEVQSNIVAVKDSVVLASSPIPLSHELFKNLNASEFSVGPINGVIGFQGQLGTLAGSYRIAIWYDWNIEKPEQCGVILDGQV